MNTVIKKLLGIITVVAIVAAAGWNFSQGQNEVEMSDLALANVEALAISEYPTIDGFNDYIVYKEWNTNYTPPRIQTVCFRGGTQVCV